ncbi:hypothetical protein K469DRAFT_356510 [Zopfia rhizophila CBS 207.26]|uniref:Acid protease n=1 Tax=Zopfia rhizophila CBS 207.26 TaxID=1314779 RepID=A0A6A6DH96_9PEZI|nr:hypothetical protein K469DRAFT_356510 [Zopfia rhizophila CBS 207.26]
MAPQWRTHCSWLSSLAVFASFFPSHTVSQCDIPPLKLAWSNITVTQDGLGVARGFELGIGTPHQIFAFRPATSLNNTRINNVLSCGSASNNSCIGGFGGGFDPSKSKTYSVSIKSQWNGSQVDAESSTGAYVYFNDDVGFQSNGHVEGFPLVMDSEEGGGAQSGLPLGTSSSFLRAAVAGRVAPSQVFGLWSGSRGVDPRDGLLVIGGYDQARINGEFSTFPVGLPLIRAGSDEIIACVEPATQRSVFTPEIATTFAQITGQNSTLYPKGMHYNVSERPMGDMTITLSNGYQTTISNEELFTPLRGSDKNGRYAITNDSIVEAGVADNRKNDPGDVTPTLGGLFLTFNYLVVDYAKGEFRLAPAVAATNDNVSPNPTTICTPSDSAAPAPIPTSSDKPGGSKMNVGAIAGGTVGGLASVAILAGLGFLLFRRRRQAQKSATVEMPSPVAVSRQPSEMMAAEEPVPVYEMPTSRHASLRKSGGGFQ